MSHRGLKNSSCPSLSSTAYLSEIILGERDSLWPDYGPAQSVVSPASPTVRPQRGGPHCESPLWGLSVGPRGGHDGMCVGMGPARKVLVGPTRPGRERAQKAKPFFPKKTIIVLFTSLAPDRVPRHFFVSPLCSCPPSRTPLERILQARGVMWHPFLHTARDKKAQ